MKQAASVRQRLVVLGILGALLLTYPLLGLLRGTVLGVPSAFFYLFLVWLGLIGVAAWTLRERRA